MSDTWVANASPIITLAKVGRLHLLQDLCKELVVPDNVVTEILAGPASDPARIAVERGWGSRAVPDRVSPDLLEWGLGAGETAVLALTLERTPATAVLDDAAARICAKAMGVEVIGTLGVVLRAKRKRLISSAAEVFQALQVAGLRVDDNVLRSALKAVGEAPSHDL